MRHLGDITKISGWNVEPVDVITGGSPCQDLSVAGLRKGMKHEERGDGETTRSGLFMEQIRIVKEMRERDRSLGRSGRDVRPRYMVWENVPGAYSSNSGKDFQAVLTEIIRISEPNAPDVKMPNGGVDGLTRDATTTTWENGAWPGAPWTPNTGELRSDENGSLSLRISTDSAPRKYYLRLSCGEKPMTKNPSVLSQVLEEAADEKYNLSETACLGILNRAERRGKELPTELKEALEIQAGIYQETMIPPSACKETESTGPIQQAATEPDGVGGGIHA